MHTLMDTDDAAEVFIDVVHAETGNAFAGRLIAAEYTPNEQAGGLACFKGYACAFTVPIDAYAADPHAVVRDFVVAPANGAGGVIRVVADTLRNRGAVCYVHCMQRTAGEQRTISLSLQFVTSGPAVTCQLPLDTQALCAHMEAPMRACLIDGQLADRLMVVEDSAQVPVFHGNVAHGHLYIPYALADMQQGPQHAPLSDDWLRALADRLVQQGNIIPRIETHLNTSPVATAWVVVHPFSVGNYDVDNIVGASLEYRLF